MARSFLRHGLALVLVSACVLALLGCRSYGRNTREARDLFYRNDVSQADAMLEKEREKKKNRKNQDVLKLDEATMRMSRGDFRGAEALLREVRDSFDTLENANAKKTAEMTAAMLTDDNSLSYPGEDYEKVMIRVMLALCSLMTDGQDVYAYANQINLKQQQIIDASDVNPETNQKIKQNYKQLAVGSYLTAILREADFTHSSLEEIRQKYQETYQWTEDFDLRKQLVQHAQTCQHSAPGNGVVHVFVMLGRGPHKVQTNEAATQLSLLAADRIVSSVSSHSVPPTIAPVPIPEVVESPCPVHFVNVLADEASVGKTATLTDVNRIAYEQFQDNKPWIVARAVARRVLKKGAIYGIKEGAGVHNDAGEVLLDVAGVIWEATEEADTRCWSLLPGKIQVARIELVAGEHEIALQGMGNQGAGRVYRKSITVENGRDTYVFATIAEQGLVGEISVR